MRSGCLIVIKLDECINELLLDIKLGLGEGFQSSGNYSEFSVCIFILCLIFVDIQITVVVIDVVFEHCINCLSELEDFVDVIVMVTKCTRVVCVAAHAGLYECVNKVDEFIGCKGFKTFVITIQSDIGSQVQIILPVNSG